MFPPIDDTVLQENPKFAALHANLTTNILTPSGSTKHNPSQKERDAVTADLHAARIRAAKRHLLRSTICNLDLSPPSQQISKRSSKPQPTSQPLPPELIELIILISSYLTAGRLPPQSEKLLESTQQWTHLPLHLPRISAMISSHLQTQALCLARILSPSTNPSFLHRTVPKLLDNITDLQRSIDSQNAELAVRRSALVSQTTSILAKYHEAVALTIRLLEQTKHGVLARHLKSKTEYLALHAQEVKFAVREKQIRGEKMLYTDEVNNALENYVEHLRDARERAGERERQARRVLWGYGVGREDGGEKEKIMKEIARVYGDLKREIEEVSRDVERLKGR